MTPLPVPLLVAAAAVLDLVHDFLGVHWHLAHQRGQRSRRAALAALQQASVAAGLLCWVGSPWAILGSVAASWVASWWAPLADPPPDGEMYVVEVGPEED